MRLALWAGPECTVNRVGETFHDQLAGNGFALEVEDLDRLCSIGVHVRGDAGTSDVELAIAKETLGAIVDVYRSGKSLIQVGATVR